MATIAVGAEAPDFSLPGADGKTVTLRDFHGRKLVLYFYPKAGTEGCTLEAHDFNRLRDSFKAAGAEVIGVSADPVKAIARFRAKQDLSIPLLSDETHALLDAYGVWVEKSMYGRQFMGIERTTVLIDAKGRIARIWPKVKVAGHAEEVLAAVQES